jgi:hypothetical protein
MGNFIELGFCKSNNIFNKVKVIFNKVKKYYKNGIKKLPERSLIVLI